MLAKRIVCLLTLSKGQLVRTKNFRIDRWYSIEAFEFKGADEICVIDVTPGEPDREATAATVERIVSEAFVPVTLGGRLRTLDDAKWAFDHGADKLLSSMADFCEVASRRYGSQAVVYGSTGGIDADRVPLSEHYGETLLQSIMLDGSLGGYGLRCFLGLRPEIVGSGCGNWQHMVDAFKAGADACATSNVLHFSEAALASCKKYLTEHGIKVRM